MKLGNRGCTWAAGAQGGRSVYRQMGEELGPSFPPATEEPGGKVPSLEMS